MVVSDSHGGTWRLLDEFTVSSAVGNERAVVERVAEAVRGLGLSPAREDCLRTAVAEATMNAIEHGNRFRAELPVTIRVRASANELAVEIADQGGDRTIPEPPPPDLDAKLAGLQSPRGWGMFLIRNMVDDLRVTSDGTHHLVELILTLGGDGHDSETA
jgi:anti-sigma regulatory factor (Ser/Thr protein kinase)